MFSLLLSWTSCLSKSWVGNDLRCHGTNVTPPLISSDKRASDVELWCILGSWPEQAVEQTSEVAVIWNVVTPMWRHGTVITHLFHVPIKCYCYIVPLEKWLILQTYIDSLVQDCVSPLLTYWRNWSLALSHRYLTNILLVISTSGNITVLDDAITLTSVDKISNALLRHLVKCIRKTNLSAPVAPFTNMV